MAVLSNEERAAVCAQFHRDNDTSIACTKAQVRSVANAIDVWLDDNSAGLNSAMNAAGGSSLTTAQKLRLFVSVARRRWNGS